MDKYRGLHNYLLNAKNEQIILDFVEIESIVGDKLPVVHIVTRHCGQIVLKANNIPMQAVG